MMALMPIHRRKYQMLIQVEMILTSLFILRSYLHYTHLSIPLVIPSIQFKSSAIDLTVFSIGVGLLFLCLLSFLSLFHIITTLGIKRVKNFLLSPRGIHVGSWWQICVHCLLPCSIMYSVWLFFFVREKWSSSFAAPVQFLHLIPTSVILFHTIAEVLTFTCAYNITGYRYNNIDQEDVVTHVRMVKTVNYVFTFYCISILFIVYCDDLNANTASVTILSELLFRLVFIVFAHHLEDKILVQPQGMTTLSLTSSLPIKDEIPQEIAQDNTAVAQDTATFSFGYLDYTELCVTDKMSKRRRRRRKRSMRCHLHETTSSDLSTIGQEAQQGLADEVQELSVPDNCDMYSRKKEQKCQILAERKEQKCKESSTVPAVNMQGSSLAVDSISPLKEILLSPSTESINLPDNLPEFIDHVEVIRCDASGGVYHNPIHGLTLRIPEGAVSRGMELEISIGVCLYGNFSFPEGLSPVSAIVWLCTQNRADFKFLKPIELIVPHFLNCQSAEDAKSLEMCFLKASHQQTATEGFQFCLAEGLMDFTLLRHRGILHTQNFCSKCIAANISDDKLKFEGFSVTCAVPRPITLESPIHFYVTYFIPTCITDLEELLKLLQLSFYEQRIFHFSNVPQAIRGKKHVQGSPSEHVTLQPRVIKKDDLDFWRLHKAGKLEFRKKTGHYPPNMKLRISSTEKQTVTVTFEGTEESEEEMAIDLTIPSSSTGIGPLLPSNLQCLSQVTTDNIPSLQDTPTTRDLTLLKTELREIRVIQRLAIAKHWKDLGIMIDFDPLGDYVNLLDDPEHRRETQVSCCRRILQEWLRGRGRYQPPTWANLIQILEDMELPNLAMELKNFLH